MNISGSSLVAKTFAIWQVQSSSREEMNLLVRNQGCKSPLPYSIFYEGILKHNKG